MKYYFSFLVSLLMIILSVSYVSAEEPAIISMETGVLEDKEFGAVYLDLTIEEFNEKGFSFGDGITVEFDNGFTLENIPYYSGYYVNIGEPLACGYPGYPHVAIVRNYSAPMWEESGVTEDTRAAVTLVQKGEYLATEELFHLTYDSVQKDGESDKQFGNFRSLTGGNIQENLIYRGASPCDNTHGRASVADKLIKDAGIRYVINLSDSEEEVEEFRQEQGYHSPYYDSLLEENDVILLNLNANYTSDEYTQKLSQALFEMTKHEGPYYIHCQEGKDRTGFVCALILSLAGANEEEIIEDYMITFENYYGITKENNFEKYNAVLGNIEGFMDYIQGETTLQEGAEEYLAKGGLREEEIEAVYQMLCGKEG